MDEEIPYATHTHYDIPLMFYTHTQYSSLYYTHLLWEMLRTLSLSPLLLSLHSRLVEITETFQMLRKYVKFRKSYKIIK